MTMEKTNETKHLFGGRIRVLALGLIRRGDQILVQRGYDTAKEETFHRPLGGGVEWGEPAADALLREFYEELGAELVDPELLGVFENIFVFNGREGHEIDMVFEARFADETFYAGDSLRAFEDGDGEFTAYWMPVADFVAGNEILYPVQVLGLLKQLPD